MKPVQYYLVIFLAIIFSTHLIGQKSKSFSKKQQLTEEITSNPNIQGEKQLKQLDISDDNKSRGYIIEIGTGSGFGDFPSYFADWSNYFENNHTQTLYLASEFPCPVVIKELQYSFEQFAPPNNWLEDVEIRIIETVDNELIEGAFYDTAGSALVWSSSNYVPATATGWADVIDIDDYTYSAVNNIIIDIVWGDNGYTEPVFHRTHRTDGGATRVLIGNADSYNSLSYEYSSTWYSNVRFHWAPANPFGDIEGYVNDVDGSPIQNAYIEIEGWGQTITDATGYYLLSDLSGGNHNIVCSKEEYNAETYNVTVVSGDIITHDFVLTQPDFTFNPSLFDLNMSPNENLVQPLEIQNTGDGEGTWRATTIQTNPTLSCDMQVALYNGDCDGWKGGLLTILVNNVPVLTDITLSSGCGPEFFTFSVNGGDDISTNYSDGNSSCGNSYYFCDIDGNLLYSSVDESLPEGVVFGTCPKDWISLSENTGTIVPGSSQFVDVVFNTLDLTDGEVITADIIVVSDPNIGNSNIPVTVSVEGDPMCLVNNLEVELVNPVTQQWDLIWQFTPMCPNFEYFIVKRNGITIGTTIEIFVSNVIPDYGTYCFEVIPVFTTGNGIPANTCMDWYVPELCWNPESLYNEQWLDSQENNTLIIENCDGDTLDFVFPDYGTGFITNVYPDNGQIPGGESVEISLTYDATGFPTGLFNEWLVIETNDPSNMQDSILNQMLVYTSGMFSGTVNDTISGDPLFGVAVRAGDYETQTDTSGYYELEVDPGTYDIEYTKLGFETAIITGANVSAGSTTGGNVGMYVTPNPVPWVYADPNEMDTQCLISWPEPRGLNEILYDGGEADDYNIWTVPGNAVGVRFTPLEYPATITGGRFNIGDGSFPTSSNFIGSQLAIGIMDDDGVNGLPGTMIDSVILDVVNYGWIDFDNVFDDIIMDGDFYLIIWQLGTENNSAPIAKDTSLPTFNNSVVYEQGVGWAELPSNDFMIRAHVVSEYYFNSSPDYYYYFLYSLRRIWDIDPSSGPESGTDYGVATLAPNHEFFMDGGYGAMPEGFVAYSLEVYYTNTESILTYSNLVNHLIDNIITFDISHCTEGLPNDVQVSLIGKDYPYGNFYDISDTDGIVVFDSVIDGTYDLEVYKPGYEKYEHFDLEIDTNFTYNIILTEVKHPPRNLEVDPLTSVATWDDPTIIKLPSVTFEDAVFPPDGWQINSLGEGWYRSNNGGSGAWLIPPGDGYYAVSNDNAAGVSNNGSNDYLISPMLDLRDCVSYELNFDYFFDSTAGQSAYVEYSIDGGSTWELLEEIPPVSEWTDISVDLTFLSGPDTPPVWLAFHSDDNGGWASGWAIDNIEIVNFPLQVDGYYIYLNDLFIAQVPFSKRSYTFLDLIYGQTYGAAVRTIRPCGVSDACSFVWESSYLHPPRNLSNNYIHGTDSVPLMWNPPMTGTIPMASHFSVVYQGPPKFNVGLTSDIADEVTVIQFEDNSNRMMGELQFSFPDQVTAGETGCETDGEFIYTTIPSGFVKYTMDGLLIETFTISGVSDIKDLAFDGEFFYGGSANTTIFVMDFNTYSLVTTFDAPATIRAIAYNEDNDTFFGNDWGTDIVNFDATGANLGSFSHGLSAIYGLAYDKWSIQGISSLWAYDQAENNLIQFALPDGEPTGFVIDVNCVTCTSGIAGGLYTHPELFEDGKVTIGGNIQDEEVWGIELADYNTGGGLIPDGLSSFNIFQDGANIANVTYNSQAPNEWINYLVEPLDPGTYMFCVSALYDLTTYGFPGDIGESQLICGDTTTLVWGFVIPMLEDWSSGTFDGWELNENPANWLINTDEGEPAPSAQFYWDPLLQNNYSSTLTSEPIIIDSITEGDIYLDFDLKLVDRNATGEEKLIVEVFDNNNWNQVIEFANSGRSEFTTNHLNLSGYVSGSTFKIRFNVTGQNSHDIESWFLDNINVTRQCSPPTNLTGEYIWNTSEDMGVEICWETPDSTRNYTGSFYESGSIIDYSNRSRSIDGFNIYRKIMDTSDYVLYDIVELQQGQSSYCYHDTFPNVIPHEGYYYKVSANYSSDMDFCESDFAMSLEIPENDYVYVYLTDVLNPVESLLNIYPNPAKNKLNINSSIPIKSVTLFNYVGQVVYNHNTVNESLIEIKTNLFNSGVYVLKLETDTGIIKKKIIISK